jgi:hypothetical protein
MWIPIAIVLGWVVLRRRAGLPILPDLFGHPFANGGMLVQTQHGAVVVPADTPVMHPADAVDQGVVSTPALVSAATQIMSQATLAPPMNLSMALSQAGGSLLDASTGNA